MFILNVIFTRFIRNLNILKIANMSDNVKIGLLQLTSTSNKLTNFDTCKNLISCATKNGAKMVFLPENFDFISENKDQAFEFSETIDGNLINKYREVAKENDIYLSLGGFHRKDENIIKDKFFNTHVIIDNKGDIKAIYDKLHLFDIDIPNLESQKESVVVKPGNCIPLPVETPLGLMGISICYDVRFPELAQAFRELSANVLTYPSCFTVPTGTAHWHLLMRARAVDNQCFVVAAAQEGQHNPKRKTYGHSLVVDPWGTVIAEKVDPGPGLLMCSIDLQSINKVRSSLPIVAHRRLDLFPSCMKQGECIEIGKDSFQFGPHVVQSSCVFYKSNLCFAFVNISPLVPGHVLVSPIRPVTRFIDLSAMEVADLYAVVKAIAPRLSDHFNAHSLTISQQDGPDAGQSVPHVHVHVLPRKPGDFANNDDIYQSLQNHDKPENLARKYRTVEEMSKEASEFRKLFYK